MKNFFKKFSFIIIFYSLNHNIRFVYKNFNNNGFDYNSNDNIYQEAINSYDFVLNANCGKLTQKIPIIISEEPKISVIIPLFNAETLIQRAIRSVQNQNFSDLEIIIFLLFVNIREYIIDIY